MAAGSGYTRRYQGALMFRYRLRTLLLLVLCAAIAMAAIAAQRRRVQSQRQLLEEINRVGLVRYETDFDDGGRPSGEEPWYDSEITMWLVQNGFYQPAPALVFLGPTYQADSLAAQLLFEISDEPRIVTDPDPILEKLDLFDAVRFLSLGRAKINDASLLYVRRLCALERLDLHDTEIGDQGLKSIATLPRLRYLNVARTRVTDAGMYQLRNMTNLECLDLDGTVVTDAGLAALDEWAQLRHLDLRNTQTTDAGLVRLRGMTRLEFLDLSRTRITDAGLVHLRGLTRLRQLGLDGTQVTDEGIGFLKQVLPSLEDRKRRSFISACE